MKKSSKNVALFAAIAAGVGYVAGVLTAPKSGKETRKDIKKTAIKSKRQAEAKIKDLHKELATLIKNNEVKIKSLKGKAETELKAAVKSAHTAKEKAREVLSALHEGEADDKDLNKAVKDLKTSIDHLKAFAAKPTKSK